MNYCSLWNGKKRKKNFSDTRNDLFTYELRTKRNFRYTSHSNAKKSWIKVTISTVISVSCWQIKAFRCRGKVFLWKSIFRVECWTSFVLRVILCQLDVGKVNFHFLLEEHKNKLLEVNFTYYFLHETITVLKVFFVFARSVLVVLVLKMFQPSV